MLRCHYEIFFPSNVDILVDTFFKNLPELKFSFSAQKAIFAKKQELLFLAYKKIFDKDRKIIEIYYNEEKDIIEKILVRAVYDFETSVNYVIGSNGTIISAWLCGIDEKYRLSYSLKLYYCPENMKKEIYRKFRKQWKK